jgi:phosphoribosylformimino-5-aminoimidazole carboxamide ribotide isomerase
VSAIDLAKQAEKAGAGTIIYTDIATDGMLTGPNYAGLQAMLDAVNCNVIASGGVSSIEDLGRLASMPRIHGAIIGKALYDGKLDLKAAADLPGVGGHKASKVSNT